MADERIIVRKVTDVHANWSADDPDSPGKFSYQLILDDGAEEAVIRPDADSADVLKDLFDSSDDVFFDTEKQNVIFRNVD